MEIMTRMDRTVNSGMELMSWGKTWVWTAEPSLPLVSLGANMKGWTKKETTWPMWILECTESSRSSRSKLLLAVRKE